MTRHYLAGAVRLLYDGEAIMRDNPAPKPRVESNATDVRSWTVPVRVRLQSVSAALRRRARASLSRLVWASMALPLAMVVVGCGSATEEMSKQIEQLQAEIRELRAAALASQDRLDALEQPGSAVGDDAVGGPAGSGEHAADRPPLDVVRLSPESADSAGDVVDPVAVAEPEPNAGKRPMVRANRFGGSVDDRGAAARTGGGAGAAHPMAGRR